MRIVYWTNMPTPYVVGRFNALNDFEDVELLALFDAEREPDRSWDVLPEEWMFSAAYLPQARRAKIARVQRLIRAWDAEGVISLYANASYIVAGALGSRRVRWMIRYLPTFDTWVPRSRWKEQIKRVVLSHVDGAKTSGDDGRSRLLAYGVAPHRIHTIRQSVDIDMFQASPQIGETQLRSARSSLGLRGTIFLYVGRLWRGKGLDTLMEAFFRLRQGGAEASLLVVGDGIDEERYHRMAEGRSDVHFMGFVQPQGLPSCYALADVLVFPTLGDPYGLVVEEAFAAGLPVISTSSAGEIVSRIGTDRGIVVPPGDAVHMAGAMSALASDRPRRLRMGASGKAWVASRGHSAWADDVRAALEKMMEQPPVPRLGGRRVG